MKPEHRALLQELIDRCREEGFDNLADKNLANTVALLMFARMKGLDVDDGLVEKAQTEFSMRMQYVTHGQDHD
jgi:hypothetical protein